MMLFKDSRKDVNAMSYWNNNRINNTVFRWSDRLHGSHKNWCFNVHKCVNNYVEESLSVNSVYKKMINHKQYKLT